MSSPRPRSKRALEQSQRDKPMTIRYTAAQSTNNINFAALMVDTWAMPVAPVPPPPTPWDAARPTFTVDSASGLCNDPDCSLCESRRPF